MKKEKIIFNLLEWLKENRQIVINEYEMLKEEKLFSGISLKKFMTDVMDLMIINDIKSEKTAKANFLNLIGRVYMENIKISVLNDRDKINADKYAGTAYMALV